MPDQLDDPLAVTRVFDMSAGQYSHPHPTDKIAMPMNAGAELLDIDIDALGKRRRRRGYSMIADDQGATKIDALLGYNPSGANRLLLMETDGEIFSWDGSASVWTSRLSGLTAPTDWSDLVAGLTRVFRLSKTESVRSSADGLTWSDEGDTNTKFPKAKFAISTSTGRMLAFNTTSEPTGGYYSNAGDPQTWDRTTNLQRFGITTLDGITGAIEYTDGDVMVMTKDEMFNWNINDADPANWVKKKVADVGCEAYRTVRLIGEDALFLSRDGVRSIIQSAQDKKRGANLPLSFPIQDWVDRINWQYVHKAVAWVWDDKYYLAVPVDSSTYNNYVFVWSRRAFEANDRRGGWSIYRNWNVNCFAQQTFGTTTKLYFGEASTESMVYFARSTDPTVEPLTDNGTTIEFSETGRQLDFDTPEVDKTFNTIEVEAIAQDGGELEIEAQVDGNGYTPIGTLDLSTGGPTLPVTLPFTLVPAALARAKFDLQKLGRGRNIQVRAIEGTSGVPCDLLGYSVSAFVENYELGD